PPASRGDSSVVPQATGDFFKSTDAGSSWASMVAPFEVLFAGGFITTHPLQSLTVYTRGATGLYKSTDGGAGWSQIDGGFRPKSSTGYIVTELVIDPTNSSTIYAVAGISGSVNSIFKSTDAGGGWNSLNLTDVSIVIIDPKNA